MRSRRVNPQKKQSRFGRERGVALIMALLILFVLSTIAAGLMFSTQNEILAATSFQLTTQARYVAEAGSQRAADWLLHTYSPTGLSSGYTLSSYPVVYTSTGLPFGFTNDTTTYPSTALSTDSSQSASFSTAVALPSIYTGTGSGLSNPTLSVAAQLLSATQSGSTWICKWKIISRGQVGQIRKATIQVVEILQNTNATTNSSVPPFAYGLMATATGCNVVTMAGGQYTQSYNSTAAGNVNNSNPTTSHTGGDVASFGNVKITNGAYIYGNLFSGYSAKGVSGGPGSSNPTGCSSPKNFTRPMKITRAQSSPTTRLAPRPTLARIRPAPCQAPRRRTLTRLYPIRMSRQTLRPARATTACATAAAAVAAAVTPPSRQAPAQTHRRIMARLTSARAPTLRSSRAPIIWTAC